jgi:monovalent cation:H+ antiporter-2, CPA2 family
MHHETTLIATIAAAMALAFGFGLIAVRFRLPPLVGYLVAGIAVGPHTPGFQADMGLAQQLSEIGVILLMFGVGIHFSVGDLLSVRRIAVPGAIVQIVLATLLGASVAHLLGWTWGSGIVFGLCLSVASTVVLLRALEDRQLVDSVDGRIAVGWLIVEDLATVLVLVLLPALAIPLGAPVPEGGETHGGGGLAVTIAITLSKVAAFVVLMFVVGRRAIPWLLERVALLGSRELFSLSVLAVAIGIAVGASALFDVSFALGAFFAGMVVNSSELSHEAAANSLPLQDAFSVLFFVAMGMLFDPAILVQRPLEVLSVVLIVMVGKSLAAFAIVLIFRHPVRTALLISASLAQIGEFSFILAALGVSLGLMPAEGQSLIVAGALLSITLNPVAFWGALRITDYIVERPKLLLTIERPAATLADLLDVAHIVPLRRHAIIVGYGTVGSIIGEMLKENNLSFVAVEQDRERVNALRKKHVPALFGDASREHVLERAGVQNARLLVVTATDPYKARAIIAAARKLNRNIATVVRTHNEAERTFLESINVGMAIVGERELAKAMGAYAIEVTAVPEGAPRGATLAADATAQPDSDDVLHDTAKKQFRTVGADAGAVLHYNRDTASITFLHTEVAEAVRGRGLAQRMAKAGLEYAKREKLGVIALCPFVSAFAKRHPEYDSMLISEKT